MCQSRLFFDDSPLGGATFSGPVAVFKDGKIVFGTKCQLDSPWRITESG